MGCIYMCEHECLCMCVCQEERLREGVSWLSAQTTRRKSKGLILKHTYTHTHTYYTRCPGLVNFHKPAGLCPQLHHQDAFLPWATPFCM